MDGFAHAPDTDAPAAALKALRAAAAAGTPSLADRQVRLHALAAAVLAQAEAIAAAVDADYGGAGGDGLGGRSRIDTLLADVKLVADAARHAARRVPRWARPQRAAVPAAFRPASAWVEPVPKGVVGILSPWNYPVQLALLPAIDALAAGNRVAIKPAEATPRTAALLAELVDAALGPDHARCVLGGVAVARAFAAQPWDHLVFTGGTATGAAVYAAAAAALVPVTLELGGKCAAIVLPGADLRAAARAVLLGKLLNAGQTCVAPDMVLLVGHTRAAFVAAARATGLGMPETAIATPAQLARLDGLCAGATLDPLAPDGPGRWRALALADAPAGHALHGAEVFGPVLPIVCCASLAGAIAWLNDRPAPLALYLFGATAAEEEAVAAGTRSGAIVHGRCVEHAAWPDLPFGGVGGSGFGRRGGEAGFREFSTLRARVRHGRWSLARLLDPPRGRGAAALVRRLLR